MAEDEGWEYTVKSIGIDDVELDCDDSVHTTKVAGFTRNYKRMIATVSVARIDF